MKAFDFHVHVFPDEIAHAAISSLMPALEKSGSMNALDGKVGSLEKSMAEAGIEKSLYIPLATKSTQTETLIKWAADLQKNNPNFLCMGTLHPNNTDISKILEKIKNLGLYGIKMHPVFQNFSVLSPR